MPHCLPRISQIEDMNPGPAALGPKPVHLREEALVAHELIEGQPQRILEEHRVVVRHAEVVDVGDDTLT